MFMYTLITVKYSEIGENVFLYEFDSPQAPAYFVRNDNGTFTPWYDRQEQLIRF